MSAVKEKIEELLAAIVPQDCFVVEVQVLSRMTRHKVLVLIDGDKGVGINQCAEISRALGEQMEALNLIDEAYTLEVSSPGVDKPLKLARQYLQHLGRTLQVKQQDGSTLTGRLVAVEDATGITLEIPAPKKHQAPTQSIAAWADIKEAKVVVSFK